MIYALHNDNNTCDVIDLDIMVLAETLGHKMPDDMDPIVYLVELRQKNDTLSEYWPEQMVFSYFAGAKKENRDIGILGNLIFFSGKAYDALGEQPSVYG